MKRLIQLPAAIAALWLAAGAALAQAGSPALPHVEVRGEAGPTLVLIHGTQGDWRVWESFMERNEDRYTMLAVRLPGAGGSEPLPFPEMDPLDKTPWTDAVVEAIATELESRGVRSAFVVGHALGGLIAMDLAATHPDLVSGVVTVDQTPAFPLNLYARPMTLEERASAVSASFMANVDRMDPVSWRVRWRQIAGRQTTDAGDSEMLQNISEEVGFDAWRRWTIEHYVPDLTGPLKESGVRVLAAAAINDGIATALGSRVMAEEFWRVHFDDWPEASVTFFEDARHYVFLDRPEAFDAMIERFVENEPQPDFSYGDPYAETGEASSNGDESR